ncbi:MAG: hypothetical protein ACPGGK_17320 [Pikeienuella sp.]
MPLPLLLFLVVGGIGGVVLFVHLLGWSAPRQFEDEAAAIKAFAIDYPDAEITSVQLSDDHLNAIFITHAGIGLIASMGAGFMARMIGMGDIENVDNTQAGLIISLADFTAPKLVFKLQNANAREKLAAELCGQSEDKT